jgi:hypothetical protein
VRKEGRKERKKIDRKEDKVLTEALNILLVLSRRRIRISCNANKASFERSGARGDKRHNYRDGR